MERVVVWCLPMTEKLQFSFFALLAVLALTALLGCGQERTAKNNVNDEAGLTQTRDVPGMLRQIGFRTNADRPVAPDFALQDTDGTEHALSDFRGSYVFLNFCQTWCSYCRSEKPLFKELLRRLDHTSPAALSVVGAERLTDIVNFVEELSLHYPVVVDHDGSVSTQYGVSTVPTTFLIDPEGRVLGSVSGQTQWDDPYMIRVLDTILTPSE